MRIIVAAATLALLAGCGATSRPNDAQADTLCRNWFYAERHQETLDSPSPCTQAPDTQYRQ